jgi:hypothetical protein
MVEVNENPAVTIVAVWVNENIPGLDVSVKDAGNIM